MKTVEKAMYEIAPHGGGRVSSGCLLTGNPFVGEDSYMDDNSEMHGNSCLTESSAMKSFSKMFDGAIASGSYLDEFARLSGSCFVDKSTVAGTAEILGDAIVGLSFISGNAVIAGNTSVTACRIRGNARVVDKAKLYNVIVDCDGPVTVMGDAILDFEVPMQLVEFTRVVEGVWRRPPKVIELPHFNMVEGANDRVLIGCMNRTIGFWKRHGQDVMTKFGIAGNGMYDRFLLALLEMETWKQENRSPKLRNKRK